jgi:L-asparaginase II
MNDAANTPVLVESRRGDMVENFHRGRAAIADADGAIVAAWGDIERPVFPRSAIKPLQTIAVVEGGAADAFGLGDVELALASASHTGEPAHVAAVAAWLSRIGLSAADLECGTHDPYNATAAAALIRAGTAATPLHNNCSGKHSGMLSLARHLGVPTKGYIAPDHPTQLAWRRVLGEMAGLDLVAAPAGTDGCSIPTIAVPLSGLARAAARFATGAVHGDSCARIRRAMTTAPFMVEGSDRFCTRVIEATAGAALVKFGAEGVFFAALPGQGLGIALKIDDGSPRAAQVAIAALLLRYAELDAPGGATLADFAAAPLYSRRGAEVGAVGPAADWLPAV